MDLRLPPELDAFRSEVRQFLAGNLPREVAWRMGQGFHPSQEDLRRWNRIVGEKGWTAPDWPVEYGGPGWSALQSYIYEDECAAAGAPHIQWRAGIGLVGPVIYNFGSAEQKARYLPPILTGEEWWCQGFSEPGSGSDLATLRTSAHFDGDAFVVRGQKIWTSEAEFAQLMICLCRTEPEAKPQRGLSCLILDMRSLGITVRPIITIDNSHTINEVFLDDVRVPRDNLIGERGAGWTYAKYLLANERHSNALVQRAKRELARLRGTLHAAQIDGGGLIEDPRWRARLTELEIEIMGLEYAVMRAMTEHGNASSGTARNMAFTSALKIRGSEIQRRVAGTLIDALGPRAMPDYSDKGDAPTAPGIEGDPAAAGAMTRAMFRRASSIYSGADDIQRGIIWQQLFAEGAR